MSKVFETTATATATVTALRDTDELDGTLLHLPVATEVLECEYGPGNEVIPTTTHYFDYDTAIASEQRQQQQQQQHIEEAILVPDNANHLNYAGVSDDSKTSVGRAERTGKIRSEREREAIRTNTNQIRARNYHAENALKSANDRARQRDKEGLQVVDDRLESAFTERELPEKLKSRKTAAAAAADTKTNINHHHQEKGTPRQKGYQVREYDCNTYDTNEYQVNEYTSMYD
mmetsp:Transcript_14385/g.30550  ORF Transcript_14385/g.30550 Transcript_14385/m.30550 type:complete len:231 (-) Transcript_14385:3467-4159(-)